ncbi:UDP-2,3-diacylglucosamine diphosphatase [candidate division WOR-3 bacterium]|nr:UDP-2,3-diacylglucosamine diphosphatase [candidate division WOR-3 bacterium]
MNGGETMSEDGKCIVVSDVHLGTEYSSKDKFIDFIDDLEDDVERLVLLGDIFDFWRRDPVGVLLENIDIVHKLLSLEPRINVFFVVGNHDFHLIKFPESYFGLKFGLNYDLSLEYGKTKYHFIHGHQLENKRFRTLKIYETFADVMCMAGEDVGWAADAIWETIGGGGGIWNKIRNLFGFGSHSSNPNPKPKITSSWVKEKINEIISAPEERGLKKLEEYAVELIKETYQGEFLIYGHTHEPFVKMEKKIANTGSWVKPSATYLEIDAEGVTLNKV